MNKFEWYVRCFIHMLWSVHSLSTNRQVLVLIQPVVMRNLYTIFSIRNIFSSQVVVYSFGPTQFVMKWSFFFHYVRFAEENIYNMVLVSNGANYLIIYLVWMALQESYYFMEGSSFFIVGMGCQVNIFCEREVRPLLWATLLHMLQNFSCFDKFCLTYC